MYLIFLIPAGSPSHVSEPNETISSPQWKLADKIARTGFLVVVPDFFYGDPIIDFNDPNFDVNSWSNVHNADKGNEDTKAVIAALRSKGISAIGAAGFCWFGMMLKFIVSDVKVPIAILGAEIDHISPPEQLKQFGEKLSAKSEFDSFVKIFPGVAHGWTVKYNVEDESAVKSAKESHLDMLNWFAKYVK
ncbi:uncharacterized protein LOC126694112 [Quercus robur]|uniref:uncharacterized protein LOC126694112 n=1 Tax=Quercus robur TaxID=38942 RepID=UPI00216282E6|nr:uncharacterized protein LOC126694112 [Quercus robur]